MKGVDRDRLKVKRALLQSRLARREAGQFCDPVMVAMRQARTRATRVLAGDHMTVVRPFTQLPGMDERIDWMQAPASRRRFWTDRNQRVGFLEEALDDLGVAAGGRILIVFHPSFSGIRTSRAGLMCHADSVLDANPEVWICPAESSDWLIESADMDVSWARFERGRAKSERPRVTICRS